MSRVVSLIASSTEILHALGFGDRQVGRSHECDYPPAVVDLPICTEPKFEIAGSSAEIDQRVKTVLQEAISVYRVHTDVLEDLAPDVILTQSQCEVCAVSLKDVEAAACQLISSQPEIVALEPNSLNDVWADIQRVATALNAPDRGEQLIGELKTRMEAIAAKSVALPRPTVACIEWIEPLMAAGNWMPTLVEMAGGENLFGEADKHSPWMTWDDLTAADPDVILLLPCGYDIPRTRQELPTLVNHPGWSELKAVQNGQVYVTDGNSYFNRPGPRLAESLEILAEILHPAHFQFGHEGTGWQRL